VQRTGPLADNNTTNKLFSSTKLHPGIKTGKQDTPKILQKSSSGILRPQPIKTLQSSFSNAASTNQSGGIPPPPPPPQHQTIHVTPHQAVLQHQANMAATANHYQQHNHIQQQHNHIQQQHNHYQQQQYQVMTAPLPPQHQVGISLPPQHQLVAPLPPQHQVEIPLQHQMVVPHSIGYQVAAPLHPQHQVTDPFLLQYQVAAPLPPQHQGVLTTPVQQQSSSSVIQLGSPGSLYSCTGGSAGPSMYGVVEYPLQYSTGPAGGASAHQIFFPGCSEPTPASALQDQRNSAIFNSFQPNRGSIVQNKNPATSRPSNMQ
jgi:hypothetical protein